MQVQVEPAVPVAATVAADIPGAPADQKIK